MSSEHANRLVRLASILALAAPAGATAGDALEGAPAHGGPGRVVVANRASGTVSVIDTASDAVAATLDLPAAAEPAEPMYVHYDPHTDRFFVGDRANDRVVGWDARTLDVVGSAPTGEGVFHMWGSAVSGQLWVNCDVDDVASVVDMRTLQTVGTVPVPADLVAAGGKPHDVVVSPLGLLVYQTVVDVAGGSDYVVQYTAWNGQERERAAVGRDAHVALHPRNPYLFVPCQGTDEIFVLGRSGLEQVDVLDVPGAHGAEMARRGRIFYTTNLPGMGVDGLFTVDARTLEVLGEAVDTPHTVPHNVVATPGGRKLYLTHSGDNDRVTVYRTAALDPVPVLVGEVVVGENPFGLAYVP